MESAALLQKEHLVDPVSPLQVTISKASFEHNCKILQERVTPSMLCAVMKADAYGHGIRELAPIAAQSGISWFGIIQNKEIQVLREECHFAQEKNVLRLRIALKEEIQECILKRWNCHEMVGSFSIAKLYSDIACEYSKQLNYSICIPIHLNLDTGMGSMGFPCQHNNEVNKLRIAEEIKKVLQLPNVKVEGIMTHFAKAYETSTKSIHHQLELFESWLHYLSKSCAISLDKLIIHFANTPSQIRLHNHFQHVSQKYNTMVRIGSALYGSRTNLTFQFPKELDLKPVMQVKTKIASVQTICEGTTVGYGNYFVAKREMTIASIPVGYSEGILYHLFRDGKNYGKILIHGQLCGLIGKISSNFATVDVTEIKDEEVKIGDEVILVGEQNGRVILAEQIGDWTNSIHLEFHFSCGSSNKRLFI